MPRKIGVVDDSVTIRTAFNLTFGGDDLGIEVRAFASADELARSGEKLDLVVIDSKLGGDGYEVCAKVRALAQFSATPVALLMGPWDAWDEARGHAVGAVGSLPKPWESDDMIGKVQALMSAAPPAVAAAPARPAAPAAPVRPAAPAATPPAPPPKAGTLVMSAMSPGRPVAPAIPAAPVVPVAKPAIPPAAPPARPAPFMGPSSPSSVPARPAPVVPARPAAVAAAAPAIPAAPAPIELEEEIEMEVVGRGSLAELAQLDNTGRPIPSRSDGAVGVAEAKIAKKLEAKGVAPDQAAALAKITREVIEEVAWEVVPDLAETIIREQIAALTRE